ncbi:MAG: zinc-ribbon domain-containing protein [Pseudomonadota bacterium]
MVQIICPNCDAKYNVPEAALGPNGRKVSCANCGNAWHAMPVEEEPMLLSDPLPAEPEPAQSGADASSVAAEATKPSDETPAPPVAAGKGDRARQLSEIRQIFDEVQTGAQPKVAPAEGPASAVGPAPGPAVRRQEPGPGPTPEPPVATPVDSSKVPFPASEAFAAGSQGTADSKVAEPPAGKAENPSFLTALTGIGKKKDAERSDDDGKEVARAPEPVAKSNDPLREKINSPADKPAPRGIEKSRKKMIRKHNRRVNKRVAREKRGSGAFTTGVLLILIVVAFMAALYLLAPQISAQVPAAEPALQNYISKVDEVRAGLGGLAQQAIDTVAPVFADE